MRSSHLSLSVICLAQAAYAQSCYYPNGKPLPTEDLFYSGFKPCSSGGPSTICCATNRPNPSGGDPSKGWTQDECLPNGLCQNRRTVNGVELTIFVANFCTDSNFTSGNCLNICEQTRGTSGNSDMTSCTGRADSETWCCGKNNTACCGSGVGIVKLPKVFRAGLSSSSVLPLAASSSTSVSSFTLSTSTSSPSPSSTSAPSTSSSSKLSGGAIAGIAIGVLALVLALAAACLFALRAHRRKTQHAVTSYPQVAEVEAPVQPPAYEVGAGEVASEKYVKREPVEMMVPPSELAGGGEYGGFQGRG